MRERFVNSTQWKIVYLLKKNGEMSVEEIGQILSITSIGVRQHMLNLERNGFVTYRIQKHGVGRPAFKYSLTEKSDELFPDNYRNFTLDIFKAIEEIDGRKKLSLILKKRKEKILEEKRKLLAGVNDPKERIKVFIDSLKDEGYIVELTMRNDVYEVSQYNCPLAGVSKQYQETCRYELELYRELFHSSVIRRMCYADGDRYCVYVINRLNS